MFNNPMSPEMVNVVHERRLHEAAARRAHLQLASPGHERPALRQTVGAALVRLGRTIADESVPISSEASPCPAPPGG